MVWAVLCLIILGYSTTHWCITWSIDPKQDQILHIIVQTFHSKSICSRIRVGLLRTCCRSGRVVFENVPNFVWIISTIRYSRTIILQSILTVIDISVSMSLWSCTLLLPNSSLISKQCCMTINSLFIACKNNRVVLTDYCCTCMNKEC